MPCFHPIDVYQRSKQSSDRRLAFQPHSLNMNRIMESKDYFPLKITCGQCAGCRLDRSRQWAMRCMHEAHEHVHNCFITLTFSPEALSKRKNEWSLEVRDFQLFMKRLRKKHGKNIRFYHCGEYGELNNRPHYHACIFGFDFPDKIKWKKTKSGFWLYTSKDLEKLWPHGFSSIGSLTFESAAYCARYIMKKQTGHLSKDHYEWIDPTTGEIHTLKPEYNTMSRRPGIGRSFFDKYQGDIYPHDYVVINGKRCKPPRYYDNIMKTDRPYEFDEILEKRGVSALTADQKHIKKYGISNNSPERLLVREKCLINNVLSALPRDKT